MSKHYGIYTLTLQQHNHTSLLFQNAQDETIDHSTVLRLTNTSS